MISFLDLTRGLMYLAIGIFFIVVSFACGSLVSQTGNIYAQQSEVLEKVNNSTEFISELGFIAGAIALEEQGILQKSAADKIVYASIAKVGDKSPRLEEILIAVNNARILRKP